MCVSAAPVRLTRYASCLRQTTHTHDGPHLSLVLAGGFEEQAGRLEVAFSARRLALRPDGMRHAGAFWPGGALILTCAFAVQLPAIDAPRWSQPLPGAHLRTLTPLLFAGESEALEAAWDLLALADNDEPRSRPSQWILSVREQLLEEPAEANISTIADRAGRHRVHLGRAFLAAFGETPSAFRRQAMLDRALCSLTRGEPAAAAAAEAGFADQSHFYRTCRGTFGVTPRYLTRGTAEVASVQYQAG